MVIRYPLLNLKPAERLVFFARIKAFIFPMDILLEKKFYIFLHPVWQMNSVKGNLSLLIRKCYEKRELK
ncbi:hypothetical protein C5Y41_03355 [Rahnella variigena]|jgi:hypothetical protein|nr:hypothetical protein C5Y41_03355 [Rahnella variigena]